MAVLSAQVWKMLRIRRAISGWLWVRDAPLECTDCLVSTHVTKVRKCLIVVMWFAADAVINASAVDLLTSPDGDIVKSSKLSKGESYVIPGATVSIGTCDFVL